MAEFHARIPGESLHEQATRLAATIAELGVTRLELHEPSGMIRDLRARAANLPALLLTLAEESDESPVEADSPSPSPAPWVGRHSVPTSGVDRHSVPTSETSPSPAPRGGGPGWGQSTPLLRVPNLGVTISIAPASLVWSARDPARAKFFDDHLISTRV